MFDILAPCRHLDPHDLHSLDLALSHSNPLAELHRRRSLHAQRDNESQRSACAGLRLDDPAPGTTLNLQLRTTLREKTPALAISNSNLLQ